MSDTLSDAIADTISELRKAFIHVELCQWQCDDCKKLLFTPNRLDWAEFDKQVKEI